MQAKAGNLNKEVQLNLQVWARVSRRKTTDPGLESRGRD